jgi:ATP-dependent helicase/nuclease subunit A
MTVHASKGLEFPIVFVVNLGRGVMRRRPPVRVHLSGDDDERGDASVSIESFMSEQDTLEPELEREESKRLLYVALTRARDRLYLSAAAKDGQVKPGPGSLAQLLPAGVIDALAGALTLGDGVPLTWTGQSRTHALRVVRPALDPAPAADRAPADPPVDDALEETADAPRSRLEPALPRQSVTTGAPPAAVDAGSGEPGDEASGDATRRLVGRLVHRLLERFRPGVPAGASDVAAAAGTLVSDEDRATVPDLDAAIANAVVLHHRLAARADLAALFADGTAAFEVPLSFLEDGRVLRGTIDCLIRRPRGDLVVIEIKTGPPRPEHERQLDAYLAAIRALEPGIRATGCLVHP